MANEYLKRTPTSTGNRKVWTLSAWIKRSDVDNISYIFFADRGSNLEGSVMGFSSSEQILHYQWNGSSYDYRKTTNAQIRDPGSWSHYLFTFDSTKPDEDQRQNIFVNGVKYNSLSSTDAVTINFQGFVNSITEHSIGRNSSNIEGAVVDFFFVDGQALTPEVFGYYKKGDGYISAGSTQTTDFKRGQWVPKAPKVIKSVINARGGFGVNGFYLPMNDASNFGADFHCAPNSIIKLKGEEDPQPRNGAPTTTDAYVSQLRTDPYAANLVLAVPGIDSNTNPELVTNGDFSNGTTGWIALSDGSLSVEDGKLKITETSGVNLDAYACNSTDITTEIGKTYTIKWTFTEGTNTSFTVRFGNSGNQSQEYQSNSTTGGSFPSSGSYAYTFTATATTLNLSFIVNQSGTYGYLSNVSVKEAVPVRDYSADIKGSGTNRTPTLNKCGVTSPVPSYYGSAISTGGAGDYLYYDLDGTDYGTSDFTFECWFYAIEEPSNWGILMKHATNSTWENGITLTSKNNTNRTFTIYTHNGSSSFITASSTVWELNQWHHVVAERYNNTLTLYVNGVAHATRDVTGHNYNVAGTPAAAAQYGLSVGAQNSSNYQSNGYFNDVRVYKGVAKYKGGFDVPKPYTPVGIETWRAVPDTTANNFATLNPLHRGQYNNRTLSNGNLTVTHSTDDYIIGNVGISTGKWYWEILPSTISSNNNYYGVVGAGASSINTLSYYYRSGSGTIVRLLNNVVTNLQSGLTNASANDVIGIALDATNKQISWYLNGSQLGVTETGISSNEDYFPLVANFNSSVTKVNNLNFGQNPTFSGQTTAGTYTDSNGKGLFKYQPPSGFLALCEDNLSTPAIKNPGEHFKTVLYTGSATSRNIVGIGFTPDLVWIMPRNNAGGYFNGVFDSVRGANKVLSTNRTTSNVESNYSQQLMSFDYDGFSLGNNSDSGNYVNLNNYNYVAWCWKAGGAAVSNSDGSIISQVSANQTAGFSIVSFTMPSGTYTVGHGLGKTPKFIITKQRDGSYGWWTQHASLGSGTAYLELSSPNGSIQLSWGGVPNSSTFTINNSYALLGQRVIAYCWAEVEGFSKFGSYVGNGNADGPFVYCGFKPAFVMIKSSSTSGDWLIMDSSRDSTNPNSLDIYANLANVETNFDRLDFLSNGFKNRSTYSNNNANGVTYIFAAFAESPFQTANAK